MAMAVFNSDRKPVDHQLYRNEGGAYTIWDSIIDNDFNAFKALAKECDLDQVNQNGETLIFASAKNGSYKILEILIGLGVKVSENDLNIALENRHNSCVQLLLKAIEVNQKRNKHPIKRQKNDDIKQEKEIDYENELRETKKKLEEQKKLFTQQQVIIEQQQKFINDILNSSNNKKEQNNQSKKPANLKTSLDYNEQDEKSYMWEGGFTKARNNFQSNQWQLEDKLDSSPPQIHKNSLLAKKLANPHCKFSIEESITLLIDCISYGTLQAKKALNKHVVVVLGNTGCGKSTLINTLFNCTMESKSPHLLGIKALKNVIVVRPKKEGGRRDEVMPIGHTKKSKTFTPQIETDPQENITYCDCPGFRDNRGPEINIANAVNIKNTITNAQSIKALILINYHSLLADRGRGLTEMLTISSDLFGRVSNLAKYQHSLLIGITQTPPDIDLGNLKEWIADSNLKVMETLSSRIFTFDPLDKGASRKKLLTQIKHLTPLTSQAKIFHTVLTPEDEKKLIEISEKIGAQIQNHLEKNNGKAAGAAYRQLEKLQAIDHITIERLLHQNQMRIKRHFQEMIDNFKTLCNFERFFEAKSILNAIEVQVASFVVSIQKSVNVQKLKEYYSFCKYKYDETKRKEQELKKQLNKTNKQIEEIISLLEKQKAHAKEQLKKQKENFQKMIREMENNMKQTTSSYNQVRDNLVKEMTTRLAKQNELLLITQDKEKEKALKLQKLELQQEYDAKIKRIEQEHKHFIGVQENLRIQREKELQDQRRKLEMQIKAIESKQAQQREIKAKEVQKKEESKKADQINRRELSRICNNLREISNRHRNGTHAGYGINAINKVQRIVSSQKQLNSATLQQFYNEVSRMVNCHGNSRNRSDGNRELRNLQLLISRVKL